ncbi:hypothetical protein ADUPG1_010177 [Aduncisulcus paluster]|uniref:Uncharacterized protein n=1 Tax=Aduncisulcus paluster TaxID=2918883 RepID=A0ABQ5JSU8_9EUKA|nr:hypothetical protein ADUPG1_010177 [Aduncisulcus paluster]
MSKLKSLSSLVSEIAYRLQYIVNYVGSFLEILKLEHYYATRALSLPQTHIYLQSTLPESSITSYSPQITKTQSETDIVLSKSYLHDLLSPLPSSPPSPTPSKTIRTPPKKMHAGTPNPKVTPPPSTSGALHAMKCLHVSHHSHPPRVTSSIKSILSSISKSTKEDLLRSANIVQKCHFKRNICKLDEYSPPHHSLSQPSSGKVHTSSGKVHSSSSSSDIDLDTQNEDLSSPFCLEMFPEMCEYMDMCGIHISSDTLRQPVKSVSSQVIIPAKHSQNQGKDKHEFPYDQYNIFSILGEVCQVPPPLSKPSSYLQLYLSIFSSPLLFVPSEQHLRAISKSSCSVFKNRIDYYLIELFSPLLSELYSLCIEERTDKEREELFDDEVMRSTILSIFRLLSSVFKSSSIGYYSVQGFC